jgi:hypothetical protein
LIATSFNTFVLAYPREQSSGEAEEAEAEAERQREAEAEGIGRGRGRGRGSRSRSRSRSLNFEGAEKSACIIISYNQYLKLRLIRIHPFFHINGVSPTPVPFHPSAYPRLDKTKLQWLQT